MNLRNTLLAGCAVAVLAAAGAHAQSLAGNAGGFNAGYSDDDLVLAFFSASDSNAQGDVLFELGSASQYTGLAAGTYTVTAFSNASGSSEISTNLTVPSTSTFWSVMGSDQTTDQLWLTGQTAQKQLTGQATIASEVGAVGGAGAGTPNADGSGYDSSQTAGNYLIPASGKWQGTTVTAYNTVSSTSDTLGLYSLVQGNSTTGSSKYLGYFTLTDTAGAFSLSFTAIPEPSTYAAILGAVTLGLVVARRRMSGRQSTLA